MEAEFTRLAATVGTSFWLAWGSDTLRIAFSFLVMVVILLGLAVIYRGSAGDTEIERPVTLILLPRSEPSTLTLAPEHLVERGAHQSKAPRVEFYVQTPDRGRLSRCVAKRPLRLDIRPRNGAYVYDHRTNLGGGGQVGIDHDTRQEIEERLSEINRAEGRRLDADTARFVIRLDYPAHLNLSYILREHPDISVRTGAWVFILTSIFSVVQSLLFR